MHIDNKNKDMVIFGSGPIQGLDDTTDTMLTPEAPYPVNFLRFDKIVFLFVIATKIYQFK